MPIPTFKFKDVHPGTKFFTKATRSIPCLKLGEIIRTIDGRQLNTVVLGLAKAIALEPNTPVSFTRPTTTARKLVADQTKRNATSVFLQLG